jgi:hypothetical protein
MTENTDSNSDCGFGNRFHGRIIASVLQKIHSLPPVRKKKILKVRQQLAEGTYDIDRRLDVALDRLLEELIG